MQKMKPLAMAMAVALGLTAGMCLPAGAAPGANPSAADALLVYVKSRHLACMQCHAIDHKVVGPAWLGVAQRYRKDPQALSLLTARIAQGCGHGPHATQSPLPRAQARTLARFILDLAKK